MQLRGKSICLDGSVKRATVGFDHSTISARASCVLYLPPAQLSTSSTIRIRQPRVCFVYPRLDFSALKAATYPDATYPDLSKAYVSVEDVESFAKHHATQALWGEQSTRYRVHEAKLHDTSKALYPFLDVIRHPGMS